MKWLLFLLFPFSLFAKLNGNHDFQVWNTDSIHIRVSRKMQLKGETEFWYGDDRKKLFYKHYQGGILYHHSPYTTMQLAYRQAYNRVNHKWQREPHPFGEITFQVGNRRGLYLGNRNRLEYRILNRAQGGHNRWRYRNRSELIPPLRFSRRNIAPFFAYEWFWQEAHGVDQQRVEGGFKIPYHQRTELKLSYVLRLLKNAKKDWIHQNVLWIHFSLHF
ncbi:MAG: DUF2490 domain-containing protein [Chlamydiales bacterium]|nr:DUF2490 domain-containing protein [Chlamydiales bacterium]